LTIAPLMTTPLLSKSEKKFISLGILEDLRSDGRSRIDYRPVQLVLNPIPQSIGSARLKLGHGGDFLVAIRAEISRPEPETPENGSFACSIDR
jgi:exosome complex component RRP42